LGSGTEKTTSASSSESGINGESNEDIPKGAKSVLAYTNLAEQVFPLINLNQQIGGIFIRSMKIKILRNNTLILRSRLDEIIKIKLIRF
jgi:hypothetical protein